MDRPGDALKRPIFIIVFSLLILSPFPKGSVGPLARAALEVQALLLSLLWLLYVRKGDTPIFGRRLLSLLSFVFICLIQIIPLPGFILGLVSERSLEIWHENRSILASIGSVAKSSMFTISLYPYGTWRETLLLLSYVAFGLVVSRVFRTESRIRLLLIPVFLVALFEASYGMYQYLSGGLATGTFVNHNHFAGLLEMSFPLALGYALSLGEWGRREEPFFKRLVSSDGLQKQVLFLFLIALMLLVLLFSGSRMGIFSTVLSLVFFYLAYSGLRRSGIRKSGMIVFVLAVTLLYGLWIGFYPVFERFLRIEGDAPVRMLVWRDMIGMIRDFPLFGTGFGTFGYAYPLYQRYMEFPLRYTYAHNDWLQLVTETGFLGFLSISTALVLFLSSSFKNLSRLSEEDHFRFFLGIGALSGIVSILIHSLADFNLHIPSNALYFSLLMGLSNAIVSNGRNRLDKGSFYGNINRKLE